MLNDTATAPTSKAARTRGNDPRELPPLRAVPKAQRRNTDMLIEHRQEMLTEAKALGLAGATDFEITEEFGVDQRTLYKWRARDPEFDAALRLSKDIADRRIEASLYQKAHGYTYRSEEIKVVEGEIVRVPTITHVPPDTTAMIFWLKNRQRAHWTDQQDINLTAAIDVKNTDVRALALALVATIQAGLASPIVIDHDEEAK